MIATPPGGSGAGQPEDAGRDASADDVRDYISDMLSQLADLAHGLGDLRLEAAVRRVALEAASNIEKPGRSGVWITIGS